ncbi:MAG: PilT protein domain protein [Pedosphaera sp.]|nr:PilT protein domain protein [Pedosphaera sp.]
MSQRIHLDANVILRFLRNDDPKHSPAAARLFQKAVDGKVALFISAVTINEVFFAFTTTYKLSHPDAARKLQPFIRAGSVEFEHGTCVLDALQRVISENVDFGDAYLAATAAHDKGFVASFDRDLQKFRDIQLYDLVAKGG